jgi:hypothetical protein
MLVSLPRNAERFKETNYDALKIAVLEGFADIGGAKEYINALIEKYPRYIRDQLRIMRKAQGVYGKHELSHALQYCRERDLISANDFRDVLQYFRQPASPTTLREVKLPAKYQIVQAEVRSLQVYTSAVAGRG